jgi:hypothetical protein
MLSVIIKQEQEQMMNLKEIEAKIKKIKLELSEIDAMRSGSLSEQYNICGVASCKCKDKKNPQKHGPYFQLSFTRQGKSSSKFIREPFVKKIKKETAQYKKFKELTNEWIALSNERSDLEIRTKTEEKDKS